MIFGNPDSRSLLDRLLHPDDPTQTIALSGPAHTGKASLIQELAKAASADDVLVAEPGIESAREATQFCSSRPVEAEVRLLFLPDLDKFTEPAQDAYLKLVEEPASCVKVLASSSNFDGVLPALRSRFRTRLTWQRLSLEEMRAYAESEGVIDNHALELSDGLPGIYFKLSHQSRYRDFLKVLESLVDKSHPGMISKPPEVMMKLDAKSDERPVIIHLLRRVARNADPKVAKSFLDLATILSSVPSANSEIYWMRTVSRITSM